MTSCALKGRPCASARSSDVPAGGIWSTWYAWPFRLMTMTLCILSPELTDRLVDVFPVLVEVGQLRIPLGGEGVVLARRAGLRFAPLVVDEPFAPHFAQE